MFEFGFWELVLILVLVLVVAGPERMPAIVRTLGRIAGRAKALAGQLRSEFERELHADDLRRAVHEAEDAARLVERDARRAVADATADADGRGTPRDG